MIGILQIILIVFALFAISRAFLRMRENKITKVEFLFWCVVWLAVIVISLIPSISATISNLFGIARGVDLLVYVSIIVIFYLIFRIYVKIESIEQDFTRLIREIAVKNEKSQRKNKK